MSGKEINHSAKKLSEAYGMTEDEFNALVGAAVDAHNRNDVKTVSAAHMRSTSAVREHCIGRIETEPSAYEQMLAAVHFRLGEKLICGRLSQVLEGVATMKKIGLPDGLMFAVLVKNLMDLLEREAKTPTKDDCDKCPKRGECDHPGEPDKD